MRESRGRTRHTPGREHKTPRSIHRREEYEREKERRQSRPRGGTLRVQEEETHILPCYRVVGTGLGTPPEENPKPLEDMEEGRSMKGREVRGEGGLPMSLQFDGKSNWKAFYAKFSRYAEVSEWTEGECRDQLCWCLDGKASEYYALLVERNHDMAYMDLIRKLEKRFGFRELPETAQVQFNNARQTPEELLEDWVDRVLSLATRAFRELPEKHMYHQAVVRLCQGTADKEAGIYASNIRPKNVRLYLGALLGGK
jgi:hypothetical protein